jgi:hypothetical protein
MLPGGNNEAGQHAGKRQRRCGSALLAYIGSKCGATRSLRFHNHSITLASHSAPVGRSRQPGNVPEEGTATGVVALIQPAGCRVKSRLTSNYS